MKEKRVKQVLWSLMVFLFVMVPFVGQTRSMGT
jgi:hypothetical protein